MRYQFIVRGSVSDALLTAFPGFSHSAYPTGGSSLFGPVQDESEVMTVLGRLSDFGLTVVEMRRLPD